MDSKKRGLLKALETEFKGSGDFGEMSLFTAEELNAPTDILRAEVPGFGSDLTSVLGEFFFIPLDDEDTLYFSTVITLSSDLPKAAAPDVAAAIARLNFYLPCGCFALGEQDKNLVFRLTVPLAADNTDKALKKDLSVAADRALGIAGSYEGYLKLVIKNEINVDEMMEMLLNGGK